MKTNRFGWGRVAVMAGLAACGALHAGEAVYDNGWSGGGGAGGAPLADDTVVMRAGNLAWSTSLPDTVAAWVQESGYTNTVTFETKYPGQGAFTNFTITGDCVVSNGVWTHLANTGVASQTDRLRMSVGGNFVLGAGAVINVDGMGYAPNNGPGRLAGGNGGGASYGGRALQAQHNPTILGTYGSITRPVDLGSGAGQRGGGAVYLAVTGTSTIDGTITADGTTSPGDWNGPGAGGSIYLSTASLTGGGDIGANGGGALTTTPTGAGGGRVAIVLTGSAVLDTVANNAHAFGGTASKGNGPAGTVYYERNTDAPGRGRLKVDNNGNAPYGDTDMNSQVAVTNAFSELALGSGGLLGVGPDDALILTNATVAGYAANNNDGIRVWGRLTVDPTFVFTNYYIDIRTSSAAFDTAGSLTIGTNATLYVNVPFTNSGSVTVQSGGNLSHRGNGNTEVYKMNYTILGNLTVDSEGRVNVDGMGYYNAEPWGAGSGVRGGSHGGRGGGYNGGVSGPCYGSITAPVTLGSSPNNAGGGAIRLTVAGTTTLNGGMSANAGYSGTSGGAGGSVWLTTSNLTGSGTITANGVGNTLYGDKGRGGGGRIAVALTDDVDFGSVTMTAYAGADKGAKGGAGTVYLRTRDQGPADGTLIVKGDANSTDWTDISSGVSDASVSDVLIRPSYGKLRITSQTLNVSGVFSNGSTFAATSGGVLKFIGTNMSRLYGNAAFDTLTCTNAGKRLEFAAGSSNSVATALTLTGDGTSNLVLRSTSDGNQWKINVALSVNPTLSYLDVRDSDASPGKKLVALNSVGPLQNNLNWEFTNPGQTNTWIGVTSTAWGLAANWDKNRAPIADDAKVIISNGCSFYPVLPSDQTLNSLDVLSGASMNLGGHGLTVSGAASIAGALIASGAETVKFLGDADFTGGSFTPAGSTVIAGGTAAQTVTPAGIAFNALRVTNTAAAVSLAGPWSASSYQSEAASVTYGGSFTATVFRATVGAVAVTQTFAAASSATVRDLYILGASGKTVTLRSTAASAWGLNVTRSAFVKYADVSYSDALAGIPIYPASSVDSLSNQNWFFSETWRNWSGAESVDFTNPNNWTELAAPDANTRVVIDGNVNAPAISAAQTVRSLALGVSQAATLTANAPLTIVENATIGGFGTLIVNSPSVVSGNCTVVSGGTITHSANAASEINKLTLSVAGNLALDTGAFISADGRGYAANQGPGRPVSGQTAASHGGRGGSYNGVAGPAYGSVLAPTNCGSGASVPGGGSVRLTVDGTAAINGTISANGASPGNGSGGAGGSVWLTAGALAGVGAVEAKGGPAQFYGDKGDGGGGRVAVYLTGSESFGSVTLSAAAVNGSGVNGGAGTIYRQTGSQGTGSGVVTIDNNTTASGTTPIPAMVNAVPDELEDAVLVLTNTCSMTLTTNAAAAGLIVAGTNAKLNLGDAGDRLTVLSLDVNGTSYTRGGTYTSTDWNGEAAPSNVSGDGEILLFVPSGTIIMIR